jgi:hypothetical protein
MIKFHANLDKFNRSLIDLAKHANVSTSKFLRNEARLLSEDLAKRFSPKMPKAQESVKIDRKMAFRIGRLGLSQIPFARLQRIINRQKPSGRKPTVQASVAQPSQRKAILALGTLAAGFLGRGNRLSARARAFVMKHAGESYGDVTIRDIGIFKWIRIRNFTPWLAGVKGRKFLVNKSLQVRASAMRNNARKIAEGVKRYWNKGK